MSAQRLGSDLWHNALPDPGHGVAHDSTSRCELDLWRYLHAGSWWSFGCTVVPEIRTVSSWNHPRRLRGTPMLTSTPASQSCFGPSSFPWLSLLAQPVLPPTLGSPPAERFRASLARRPRSLASPLSTTCSSFTSAQEKSTSGPSASSSAPMLVLSCLASSSRS